MTRGKERWVARSGGGNVRDIDPSLIADAFQAVFGKSPSQSFLDEVTHLLSFREAVVCNPNATVTQRQIEQLSKKARGLQECLAGFPAGNSLLQEIMFSDTEMPRPEDDFWFYLVALQKPDLFLQKGSDAMTYRGAIRTIGGLIEAEGERVSTTESGKFCRILGALDDLYSDLIFPKNTVKTARRDYLRESLET